LALGSPRVGSTRPTPIANTAETAPGATPVASCWRKRAILPLRMGNVRLHVPATNQALATLVTCASPTKVERPARGRRPVGRPRPPPAAALRTDEDEQDECPRRPPAGPRRRPDRLRRR